MPAVQFNIVCTGGIKVNRMVDIAGQNGGEADDFPRACVLLATSLLVALSLPKLPEANSSFLAYDEGVLELAGVRQ